MQCVCLPTAVHASNEVKPDLSGLTQASLKPETKQICYCLLEFFWGRGFFACKVCYTYSALTFCVFHLWMQGAHAHLCCHLLPQLVSPNPAFEKSGRVKKGPGTTSLFPHLAPLLLLKGRQRGS